MDTGSSSGDIMNLKLKITAAALCFSSQENLTVLHIGQLELHFSVEWIMLLQYSYMIVDKFSFLELWNQWIRSILKHFFSFAFDKKMPLCYILKMKQNLAKKERRLFNTPKKKTACRIWGCFGMFDFSQKYLTPFFQQIFQLMHDDSALSQEKSIPIPRKDPSKFWMRGVSNQR